MLPFALGAAVASGLSNVAAQKIGVRILNIGAVLLVAGMGWLLWVMRNHRVTIGPLEVTLPLLVGGFGSGPGHRPAQRPDPGGGPR